MLWTRSYWSAVAERALKTAAQALIAILAVGQTDVLAVDWQNALAVTLTAALLSVLSSIASAGIGNAGPSLADETVVPHVERHHAGDLDADDAAHVEGY